MGLYRLKKFGEDDGAEVLPVALLPTVINEWKEPVSSV
jgi:hypothetical protein